MRLVRRSNGIYHFRLILPQVLKRALGKREVHHSLKTRKKRIATTRANKLYKSYMDMIKDDTLHDFLVELANGTKVTIKHDDPEEERKHLQAVLDRNTPGQRRRKLNDFLKSSLSELIDEYLTSTADEVTHRTQKERIRALGMYEADQINQEGANEFSKMLRSKDLSPATINKQLALLGAFNTWLVNRGHAERNFFTNLKIKKVKQTHTERDPFNLEEVQLLLKSTSGLNPTTTSRDGLEGFKYWLPRLALYTGCRLNELSQLYLEDIQEVDNLLCLTIQDNNEGQHLKNLSSKRTIPIHPAIADGFKEYLSGQEGPRVFPDLTWTKASFWGGKASNWFGRYKKTLGIEKPFHSLRHTFASNLLANGVDSRIIGELLGHSAPGETGRYTGKRPVGQLYEAIKTLEYI